jgi:hypothetical protein
VTGPCALPIHRSKVFDACGWESLAVTAWPETLLGIPDTRRTGNSIIPDGPSRPTAALVGLLRDGRLLLDSGPFPAGIQRLTRFRASAPETPYT